MAEPASTAAPMVPLQPGIFVDDASGVPRLAGTRCRTCGTYYFPRRQVCAQCLGTDTETVPLSERGVLYTYTVVYQSTPEFRTPYLLGYVDLPEGVRVLAPLADLAVDDVRAGMPLRLVVEPVRTDAQGRVVLGYRLHRAQPDETRPEETPPA